jgi:hypothetical protein
MSISFKLSNSYEELLYNKILSLSRNKFFYTKFQLKDTFQNRINLIFFHISFIFIKLKDKKENFKDKEFSQKVFDIIFKKIELNMREIGYGDTVINKNMKSLVKAFYNILIFCESFENNTAEINRKFLLKKLESNINENGKNNDFNNIVEYFDKYSTFCFDLSQDSVLKGELNFKINGN